MTSISSRRKTCRLCDSNQLTLVLPINASPIADAFVSAAQLAQVQFVWIDIEDEADMLHPLDVEDFPTLLLAVGDEPPFSARLRRSLRCWSA